LNKFKLHITLLVLTIWSFSFSQEYVNYTIEDGLPSNHIYRMTQDQNGFIWFITVKGISKFDGDSFKNFTINEGLPTNDVWDIRITPDNKVWYFSKSETIGYIENDRVYSFSEKNKKEIYPRHIYRFGNEISIQEDTYRLIFKDSFWEKENHPANEIHLLNQDKYLKKINVNEYEVLNKKKELLLSINNAPYYITQMFQLNDSLYLFNSDLFYKLINLNTLEVKYVEFSKTKEINGKLNTSRVHLVNNEIQISGDNHLICLDANLDWKEHFKIPKQLNSHFSFKDRDGFIWVATRDRGIFKLPKNYGDIEVFFTGKEILKIKEIDSVMYVSVKNKGVYTFKNNKVKLFIEEKELLHDINKIGDSIFFVYDNFIIIEANGLKKFPEPNEYNFEKSFIKYHNNLFSYGYMRTMNHTMSLSLKSVNAEYSGLFICNDTLFSFKQKQLLYFQEEIKEFSEYPQQLKNRYITFFSKENETYIGTEGDGLYSFKYGKLTKLVQDDDNIIDQIFVENPNSLWVISEGLLNHYKKVDDRFKIVKYDQINGLTTNNLTSVFVKNNKLYLGFKHGLSVVNTTNLEEIISYSAYINELKVNESIFDTYNINIPYKSTNTISINFGAINFSNRKNLKYQYKLLPNQSNWITTNSGEVNLFNLPPNNYTLTLKVINNNDEKTLQIPIKIIPKWWQGLWFKIISVLTSLFLIVYVIDYFIKKRRIKRDKKLIQEKQLAQIQLKALRSQMNPHFVFNSLAAIQYYISENDFNKSDEYLVKFSKLIRRFFELSKENEIAISEEIKLLKNYLEIETLRFRENLTYSIVLDKNINTEITIIPTMLLQPIVENAINHGIFNKEEGGNVTISFKQKSTYDIIVEIKDDGVGFVNSNRNSKKEKSSNVLRDRLYYLNQSGNWNIKYSTREAFPNKEDKGNISTFIINKL